MNRLFVLLILCCFATVSYSQSKGFLGKTNEVSVDVFSMAYAGIYGINYKKILGKKISLNLSFSRIKSQGKLYPNYNFFYFKDKSKKSDGTIKTTGIDWGVTLIYSNPFTGMEAPFGNYFGIGFEYLRSNSIIKVKNNSPPSYSSAPPYGIINQSTLDIIDLVNRQCRLAFVYGRDSYLVKNIILDMNVRMGIEVGSLNSGNEYNDDLAIFPRRGEIGGNTGNTYVYFFLYPEIKIGYIF
jgi:hypothetical protein